MNEKNLFDNKSDDWLKKERIRESKISVWDLDDRAKFLKDYHSENCDRKDVYMKHQENCEVNDYANEVTEEQIINYIDNKKSLKSIISIFVVVFITFFLFLIIGILI